MNSAQVFLSIFIIIIRHYTFYIINYTLVYKTILGKFGKSKEPYNHLHIVFW